MGIKKSEPKKTTPLERRVRTYLKRQNRRAGNWMDAPGESHRIPKGVNVPLPMGASAYDPDKEFVELATTPVKNPVHEFHKAFMEGKVEVEEAWLYEGRVDYRGRMIESKVPYRIRHVTGAELKEAMQRADGMFKESKARAERLAETKRRHLAAVESLKKQHLLEDGFNTDVITTAYAPEQFTEFTPLYSGPFNKQLYIHDYLSMHAKAFQAKNHNPIAKRIIDVLAQYAFGRRFKVRIKDEKKKNAWMQFNRQHKIIHKFSEFWIREYLTYGELMIDKLKWQSIDPSTVWDIITDPDDISMVYYYYQCYSTAYQTFTGYKVKGAPAGGDKAAPEKFIIRQLPSQQVIHTRGNVVSQEKRGRSILFSVLGWLKRVNDLYNAEVIRAQLQASFIWDDTIKGSAADVQAHAATYSTMPVAASVFAHNEAVERKPMPAMTEGTRGGGGVSDELLSLIATAVGIPKEFFNVIGAGGGNRATALVSAEPFEKAVEDLQAKGENLLLAIAEEALTQAGLDYEEGDVEFTFPSVTRDTTSETIKNIGTGQTMQWIADETAAEMYAAEMNITTFDYKTEKGKIAEDKENGIDPLMPPSGRFGNQPAPGGIDDGSVPDDVSPIHGTGKKNLKGQLNRI